MAFTSSQLVYLMHDLSLLQRTWPEEQRGIATGKGHLNKLPIDGVLDT